MTGKRDLDTAREWGRQIIKTNELQEFMTAPANAVFAVIDPNILEADGQPRKMSLSGIIQSAADQGLLNPSGTASADNIIGGSGIFVTTSGEYTIINAVGGGGGGTPLFAGSGIYLTDVPSGELINVAPDDLTFSTVKIKDSSTDATVTLSVRQGSLTVTDPFTESISNVDLGGTTPDPGSLTAISLDGSGRYTVGPSTSPNANGLITLEYINSPGQFFVISDIDGGVFGNGDRQGFGLVRETLYDRTDLDGGPAPLSGGSAGGWSVNYFWYYTGGFPYLWTNYTTTSQTPQGSGMGATGTYSNQLWQRRWWELCGLAGVGKTVRFGIANGSLSDQTGQNFSNRLIGQYYVHQEMLDHPQASNLLPPAVITNGQGWYTAFATNGEYENMGQFPNGQDKGYRFRWSTFGNTTLNQLPFVTGVSNNDQITAAAGQSHYIVYNGNLTDIQAANSILASGTVTANNRFYADGSTAYMLQYQDPYAFPNTPSGDVFNLSYTDVAAVENSPLFVEYPITTVEEINAAAVSVAPLQKLHAVVCTEILDAVTAYYLVRNLNQVNTTEAITKLQTALNASLSGQLRNLYDAVVAAVPDDSAPEGTGGVVLFPANLKAAILNAITLWLNTFPDN